jgi:hypothetical protein
MIKRIRSDPDPEAQKHADPTDQDSDLDPQHCLKRVLETVSGTGTVLDTGSLIISVSLFFLSSSLLSQAKCIYDVQRYDDSIFLKS